MTYEPIPGTLVIGIGHRARQGKDSAAKFMVDEFGSDVQRFAFADDLYAVCRALHGMTTKDAPLLQRVGLEMREQQGADVWIRAVHSKIVAAKPRVAVITDMRFPNEMAFVRAMGGVCWKIQRILADGSVFVDHERPATHISETALDDAAWDRVIESPDGQMDVLRERVLIAIDRTFDGTFNHSFEPVSVGQFGYVLPGHVKMRV